MNRILLILISVILPAANMRAQEQQSANAKYVLTLNEVVELAKQQSPQSIQARHRLRASYFSFMEYRADFLPKLTFTANPVTWDHSIRTNESIDDDGNLVTTEAKANILSSTAGLALSQNIGFTGGTISLGSDFSRRQNLNDNSGNPVQFTTTPVRLSLNQPLNGYNQFKWSKLIEPILYEEAKQNYIVEMENVASRAVDNFFSLAIAQVNLNMLETNLKRNEELYNVTKGRYAMGTVAEDDLLRVELRYMQAESGLNSARIEIESMRSRLRSFLGFTDNVELELLSEPDIPSFRVPYEEALNLALTRNPDIISYNRQILEAERTVAQAKSQKGITLTMDASFGLNKTGITFENAYSPRFDDREGISVGIRVPILDWSQARNRYRNAQSNLEVREAQMQQSETDFKQDVYLQVTSFNMQENQLRIAAMSDTIARKSYEVSYARYMLGKGNVTDLNLADTEKDNAKIGYMRELRTFWNLYYTVRRLTLFDFLNTKPLEEDFDTIIGE